MLLSHRRHCVRRMIVGQLRADVAYFNAFCIVVVRLLYETTLFAYCPLAWRCKTGVGRINYYAVIAATALRNNAPFFYESQTREGPLISIQGVYRSVSLLQNVVVIAWSRGDVSRSIFPHFLQSSTRIREHRNPIATPNHRISAGRHQNYILTNRTRVDTDTYARFRHLQQLLCSARVCFATWRARNCFARVIIRVRMAREILSGFLNTDFVCCR